MGKNDKLVRFPLDAWEKWRIRKEAIESRIKFSTGKNVKVPMTNVFRFYGNKQLFIWDDELNNYFLNRKRRRLQGVAI